MKKIFFLASVLLFCKNLNAQVEEGQYTSFLKSQPTVHKLEYQPSFQVQELDLRALERNQNNYIQEEKRKSQIEYQRTLRMYQNLKILEDRIIQDGMWNKYNSWNEDLLRYEVYDKDGNKVGYIRYNTYYEKFIRFTEDNNF